MIRRGTSALGQEKPAQDTSINITQLRQPTAKDLTASDATKQQASSIIQPSTTTDSSILEETSVHLDQIHRPDAPQTVQYKTPADIQPSTGSILKTTSALGEEVSAQETSITLGQVRQQQSQASKQKATAISQPSFAVDTSTLDETAVHLDQIHRPQLPQPVEYKTPSDVQPMGGSIHKSASALGQEEPAQETSINVTQFTQPIAQNLPVSDAIKQHALSVMQPSATTDLSTLEETSIHLDQILRPDVPQTIQYKAPGDIQLSTGSILTTTSALGHEEPAQETSINITQLRQPTAKDLIAPEPTKLQASSIIQPSATTDLSILEETPVHLDQIHRPDAPQAVQYKTSSDIQPSTGTILTAASAMSEEEPAQDTSINISQRRQATAQELPSGTKQRASSISQPSLVADSLLFDETAFNIDQIHRAQAPQPFEYKAPANIKELSATLHSSPSALASGAEHDETVLTSVEGYQQQHGHKTQRPAVISDLSYAPAEDEFAELPYELRVQQQRLLKMPPKLREQPRLIQSPVSVVESEEQTQSTTIGQRRRMVPAVQEQKKKDTEEEMEEKDTSISPEPSMDVDEVIETLRLEDELLESKAPFVADIPVPTEEIESLSILSVVEVLPSIEELPQATSEEISTELNQLESVTIDQRVVEDLPQPINMEVQSLLKQLDQVSSVQPAPLDLPVTEEVLPAVTIEKEPPTPMVGKTEEPFEIISSKVIDYIPIPPSKTNLDEQIPEAIIITAEEVNPAESISAIEGKFCC